MTEGFKDAHTQHGMVLLVSLVLLLLISMIGISSMQNATLQEKMAGSIKLRNQSFQAAEAALRIGESAVQLPGFSLDRCTTIVACAPPSEALTVSAPGTSPVSGVTWIATNGAVYALQNFAETTDPVNIPPPVKGEPPKSWTLYRITGVGIQGNSRTVLESVYTPGRRIMWRQIQ
ncbi:MAG: pilus assembly protein PilX [Pseudomonas sp.]|jgi:type IV pilus assembly protein PilX|uniref:pilus assembly PilX family protein n=1 Tax=Pseudomonas sp. TaxID=306 RepID=UPI00261D93F8|nr:PilX N-terminal domain-containing pilus assembly protein [Pseudomonas sp.]MDB6050990.1 pilus assembly protein PilX [Pseudomonas sp.]